MSWSWTLYRYLAEQFLAGIAIVYSVFLLLAFSIDVVDLTNRTAGHNVSTLVIVGMAMLQLPDLGQKMLPFAVLLGGVFAFARLSRSQEFVAIRAAGMSAWDFLAPPLAVAAALGIFAVTDHHTDILAHAGPIFGSRGKVHQGRGVAAFCVANGLWLRQGDEKQQSVIHALRVTDQGSSSGRRDRLPVWRQRPFRRPHRCQVRAASDRHMDAEGRLGQRNGRHAPSIMTNTNWRRR